jgi:amidase
MRHTLSAEHRTYSFYRQHEPALTVQPGDEVLLSCHDCMDNTFPLAPDADGFRYDVPGCGNPATGPVAIEGALPGMTLRTELLGITSEDQGLIWSTDRRTTEKHVRIPQITDGEVTLAPGLSFRLDPVVGVMGVAPASGAVPNTTPGRHGGNLDCTDIKPGAIIYFPVTVPGALFGCGDLHALQGDGEAGGMGVEVRGEVLVRFGLQPRIVAPWPIVEQSTHFAILTAATTLDEAAELAVIAGRDLLMEQLGVSDVEAGMLEGMLCDVRINQIVNPLKGTRLCIPKTLLPELRF